MTRQKALPPHVTDTIPPGWVPIDQLGMDIHRVRYRVAMLNIQRLSLHPHGLSWVAPEDVPRIKNYEPPKRPRKVDALIEEFHFMRKYFGADRAALERVASAYNLKIEYVAMMLRDEGIEIDWHKPAWERGA